MSENITTIELPTDLDWEDVGEGPDTHLGVTVTIWGIRFYVDAIAVNESGEALCPSGFRILQSIREIDDYEIGALYETVELRPGMNYMIVFTPGRISKSDPRLALPILQAFAEHPDGLTLHELTEVLNPFHASIRTVTDPK
jgi:hypothetical protein